MVRDLLPLLFTEHIRLSGNVCHDRRSHEAVGDGSIIWLQIVRPQHLHKLDLGREIFQYLFLCCIDPGLTLVTRVRHPQFCPFFLCYDESLSHFLILVLELSVLSYRENSRNSVEIGDTIE
jgi:hypothetical protein